MLIPGLGYLCDKLGIYLFGKEAFKWYLGLCKSMATESEKSADTGNLRANSIMSLFLKNKIPDSAAKKSTKGISPYFRNQVFKPLTRINLRRNNWSKFRLFCRWLRDDSYNINLGLAWIGEKFRLARKMSGRGPIDRFFETCRS